MGPLVLFDFAQTVAEMSPSRESIVGQFVQDQTGLSLSLGQIARAYSYLDTLLPYSSLEIADSPSRADFYSHYNRQLLTLLGVQHLLDSRKLFATFKDHKPQWQPKPGAIEVLESLVAAGATVALLSNFDRVLEQLLEQLGLRHFFSELIVSQEVQLEKPDPRFYEFALNRLACQPSDCLYFGDSYSLDFLPACQLGIRAYLLDEQNLYPHLPQRITTIREVGPITLGDKP